MPDVTALIAIFEEARAFLALADRFDRAMASHPDTEATPAVADAACRCLVAPRGDLTLVCELGMDRWFAEISLLRCPDCARRWLRYLYQLEATTGSGRWYLGLMPPGATALPAAADAKQILESLDWYFYGGSYYQGNIGRKSGAIILTP